MTSALARLLTSLIAVAATSQTPLDLMAQAKAETDLGNYEAAVKTLKTLTDATNATPALKAEASVRLGVALRGAGDLEAAVQAFETARKAPGLDRDTKALLVQALGGALPSQDRWAQIWRNVSFVPDRSDPKQPTLSVVWPDIPAQQVFKGKPIALDFKDADIQDVFRLIADASGLNVVVFPGVRGRVTYRANDEPWDRGLDRVLAANGLGYQWDDNVLLISRPAAEAAPTLDGAGEVVRAEEFGCMLEARFPEIRANVKGDPVARPRVYFRSSVGEAYYYVEMVQAGDAWVGKLPKPKFAASPVRYYVQAAFQGGRRVRTRETTAVVVNGPSQCAAGASVAALGPDGAVTVFSASQPAVLPTPRRYSGARVDLEYDKRDLADVLTELAAKDGATAVVDPSVSGRVTLKLHRVRWDQAFDVVLWVNGLEQTRDGETVKVFPRRTASEPR